jgi:hypothetical protein
MSKIFLPAGSILVSLGKKAWLAFLIPVLRDEASGIEHQDGTCKMWLSQATMFLNGKW